MNASEMKEALAKICDDISPKDCMTDYCPLCELCAKSRHTPRAKEDDEIIAMYAEAVRRGAIKEEQ